MTKDHGLPFRGGVFWNINRRRCAMQIQEVAIPNRLGLHARASARLVQLASRFRSEVSFVVRERRASARSIVAVMLLSAAAGTMVRVEVDGPDEVRAMREITELIQDGFGERS